jgi:amidase
VTEPVWTQGAADLAAAITAKEVSAREVVDAFLDRIERVNPAVNAVTVVLAEEARRAADAADVAVAEGRSLGPLHGVPFTVKENIDLTGSATTQGTVAMKDAVPPLDAPQPARLKAAGAIPIARTNMPDFGLRWHTDNGLRGATRNPWDAARTPGGSSGGEAVALATGMTPLGLGNDLGGSLRVPSYCCGTTALKPTIGRIPQASSIEPLDPTLALQMMAVEGPMARHVRDLRLAYGVAAGPDARDPWSVPAPLEGPPLASPVRVAVVADPGGLGVDAAVAAGVRAAADALADAGYDVVDAQPPRFMEAFDSWAAAVLGDVAVMRTMIDPLLCEDAVRFLDFAMQLVELRPDTLVQSYLMRQTAAREWSLFQVDHPVIVGPVMTTPPFPVGRDLEGVDAVREIQVSLRLTVALNGLGLPAVAVPTGVVGGLPTGVQVIGARYREDVCLDAAEVVERRLGTITPIDPAGS